MNKTIIASFRHHCTAIKDFTKYGLYQLKALKSRCDIDKLGMRDLGIKEKNVGSSIIKTPKAKALGVLMVPLTGLEPVRRLIRGILSPLCLPIPPQRRTEFPLAYNITS